MQWNYSNTYSNDCGPLRSEGHTGGNRGSNTHTVNVCVASRALWMWLAVPSAPFGAENRWHLLLRSGLRPHSLYPEHIHTTLHSPMLRGCFLGLLWYRQIVSHLIVLVLWLCKMNLHNLHLHHGWSKIFWWCQMLLFWMSGHHQTHGHWWRLSVQDWI